MSSLQTIHLVVGSSEPILGGVLGITHASLQYPDVLNAIHNIALTRPRDFTTDPYMSAQLNDATSLPIHKDKNNLSMTWLVAFGDFTGGRLWLESPIGTEPPPAPQTAWEKIFEANTILS